MFLSLAALAPDFALRAFRLDTVEAVKAHAPVAVRAAARQSHARHGLGRRSPVHALLADAGGVWAWAPDDAHAAATRHACVSAWFDANPGSAVRLWVAAKPTDFAGHPHVWSPRDEQALGTRKNEAPRADDATAGIDLSLVHQQARRHGVRLQSIVPWWQHAFVAATRCVSSLKHAERGTVCVVEGAQVAWVTTAWGLMVDVQQHSLATATVSALQAALVTAAALQVAPGLAPVVLGQGLADGACTRQLKALVLGRLDGDQPPLWLRPSTRDALH